MDEKKNYPKVLVAAPTYSGKDYMFDLWYNIITHLDYPNYDILIVDNSSNHSYVSKLRRRGYRHIVHIPRGINSREALARSMMYIKRSMLEKDYEYLMSIETDLTPPKDVIQRLMAHDKDVAGAVYEIGLKPDPNTGRQSRDAPRRMCIYGLEPDKEKAEGKLLNLVPIEMGYKMLNTGLQQVTAMGFGCTLIKRNIIEKFDFTWNDKHIIHSDMLFYRDLFVAGQPVFADTDIFVEHFNQNWLGVKDM